MTNMTNSMDISESGRTSHRLLEMSETMYAMKPVFDLDAEVEVPSCMYSLPVIQSSNTIPGVGLGGSPVSPVSPGLVEALEARQDAILARLEKLQSEVAAYKKCLGLPGAQEASQVRIQLTTGAPNITVPLCFLVFFPRHL